MQTLLSANQSARTIVVIFRDGQLENLSEGGGAGAGEVQQKYSRKGKLKEKKFMHANKPKKYLCYGLKNIIQGIW